MTWKNARTQSQNDRAEKSAEKRRYEIRAFLKDRHMTQKTFCELAGISLTTMSRFMSGRMQTGSFAYTLSGRFMKKNR